MYDSFILKLTEPIHLYSSSSSLAINTKDDDDSWFCCCCCSFSSSCWENTSIVLDPMVAVTIKNMPVKIRGNKTILFLVFCNFPFCLALI